ncbi:DUF411 domain-containing protein [Marivita sp. S6314]|uniref:DUF411 domain-containing protein n=1 Tax=Marivita sp. S6314 TaxID=2926406 RepID=UPI001FF3BDD4|nr:DUF411 domain-containing protein [Marivita sp. S6314]MCK0148771.1 DUF411 domain-containing protein [Marivita sp. S6314]
MSQQSLSRRAFVSAALAATITATHARAETARRIQVFKDPNCGCCGAWVDILKQAQFDVTVTLRTNSTLVQEKIKRGIPAQMASCHTADIDGYAIEGHVPVRDILRLLEEQPDAIGLAVPGMPFGSPGMGPESQREAYDVFLMRRDGTADVFSSYVDA